MLRTLDPHTTFLEPKEYADMQDRQKGSFYGLGILVTKRNDQITVITPLEGTPAARLGIRAGDVISDIEGIPTDDLTLDEVVKRLKGPKGTTVHIKCMLVGIKEPMPLTIVRAAIPTNSISNTLMIRPGVGYIRIKDFTSTTVRELDDAVDKLRGQGLQKLVLDLRGNPGGLLDAAVGVADHFLDTGQMVVYTSGRNIQRDYSSFYDYYVADDSDDASNSSEIPLKDRKQFKTDTGRLVYGGGGITPDVFVKPAPLSRITQLLEVRSAIFNYAVEYASSH